MRKLDTFDAELRRLQKAVRLFEEGKRQRPPVILGCCVCGGRPAPETRFGPRCERHRSVTPDAEGTP